MKNIYIHSPSHPNPQTLHLPSIYFLIKAEYLINGNQSLNWILPIFQEISPKECIKYLKKFETLDYFIMSVYNWNEDHMIDLAKLVKKQWPNCMIVAGGYQVTKKWIEYDFIDRVILGDPENNFAKVIDSTVSDHITENYINEFNYSAIVNLKKDLEYFVLKAKQDYPDHDIVYVWETNRGCPYSCVFCNWGSKSRQKLKIKNKDIIYEELSVLLSLPINILRIADANFGILKQDEEIADFIIKNKNDHLKELDISWVKNNKDMAFKIGKKLQDANLIYRFKYGLQDIHEDVGKAIERPEKIHWTENFKKFAKSDINVPLRIDLIIGLPEQTKNGYFNQIQQFVDNDLIIPIVPPLQILPNTPASDPEYIKKYSLKYRKIQEISVPGYITKEFRNLYGNYGVDYYVDQVISTSTATENDIREMIIFTGIVQALYGGNIITNKIDYIDLYENFFKNEDFFFSHSIYLDHLNYMKNNPTKSQTNIPLFLINKNFLPTSGAYFYTNILFKSDVFEREFTEYSGLKLNPNIITYQNSNFKDPIDFMWKIGWKVLSKNSL